MATVAEVTRVQTSGLNHIDALQDTGPAWNYLLPGGNMLSYTFSVASGNEDNRTDVSAFTASQQTHTHSMLAYISSVTGIVFSETTTGTSAVLHFAMNDIVGPYSGLCSWRSSYSFDGSSQITSYSANAYVYLDSVEWGTQNLALAPGNQGYAVLLHEMGHALGLKHPFEGDIRLPTSTDNTTNTVMSYTESGGPYSTFQAYDLAALNWLYGGDGLAGQIGMNSANGSRYLTGSANSETLSTGSGNDILIGLGGNDTLVGLGGNDTIDGGVGFDTAQYGANRSNFTVSKSGSTVTVLDNTGALGTDTLSNIERVNFSDRVIAFDTSGDAGKAYRVYQAAFDRMPDAGGLGFWIKALESQATLQQVAQGFVNSGEFLALYGSNASPESIVTKMYNNVLHRAPEQGGFDFWVNFIKTGNPVALVLAEFSESPENIAQVIGVIQNGIEFIPFG